MQWRDLVKYHQYIPMRTVNLLDTLETIISCPTIDMDNFFGKDLHLTGWVRQGVEAGIITPDESDRFYMDVAPNL
jgi:hypothetical protein